MTLDALYNQINSVDKLLALDLTAAASLTQIIGDLGQVIAALAACLLLAFMMWQTRAVKKTLQSNAYQGIHQIMMDMHTFLYKNPELIHYIHGNREIIKEADIKQLHVAAEMILDIFDNIFCQRPYIPEQAYKGFEPYMRDVYANSPLLKDFIKKNPGWYTPEFITCISKSDKIVH